MSLCSSGLVIKSGSERRAVLGYDEVNDTYSDFNIATLPINISINGYAKEITTTVPRLCIVKITFYLLQTKNLGVRQVTFNNVVLHLFRKEGVPYGTHKVHLALAFTFRSAHHISVKGCPTTRHVGAWGERRYSSYLFLTLALDGGEWSASRPAAL
jgi:hypothetical protein